MGRLCKRGRPCVGFCLLVIGALAARMFEGQARSLRKQAEARIALVIGNASYQRRSTGDRGE